MNTTEIEKAPPRTKLWTIATGFRRHVYNVYSAVLWVISVIGRAGHRFYWDDCFSRAAALAYTTLFSLVPISALGFSMFNVFGVKQDQLSETMRTVLHQFMPPTTANMQIEELQEQVFRALHEFSQNIAALNTLSIAALCFSGVALLNTIESALNVVWRVASNLSIFSKIVSFWAVITLGPLLIAMSIYLTTKVHALMGTDPLLQTRIFGTLGVAVPIVVSWLALTLLFYKLPAAKVRLSDAAFGALISAVLFEWVKLGFAYYVGQSASYRTLYGVLATVPLFLFWLYLTWVTVLFGAEIAYQAGSIKILSGLRKYATDLGEIGAILGLKILCCIGRNFLDGKPPPSEGEIALETSSDPVQVRTCLDILTKANIITVADPVLHSRTLVVSPDRLLLRDVLLTFRSKIHEPRGGALSEDARHLSQGGFLELIRNRAESSGGRPVGEWTLDELIR